MCLIFRHYPSLIKYILLIINMLLLWYRIRVKRDITVNYLFMKNFLYALRQVLKMRWSNGMKLLSLVLGITISSTFMCRVAYEQSFDNFHPDVQRLNILYMHYNINGKDHGFQRQCLAPIALELRAKMPNVIAATRFQGYGYSWFLKDNVPNSLCVAEIDTSFFDVFRFPVLSGNPKHILSQPSGMMLSKKTAEKLYPNDNPIGKQLVKGNKIYTVEGIFEDIPGNSHLDLIEGVVAGVYREDWDGGDNSYTYFRTKDDATPQELTTAINKLLAPRFATWKDDNIVVDFEVDNIRGEFAYKVKEIDLIMTLLSLIVILVAGFNFALLSIGSMAGRAKEVAAHKASGASFWDVFWMMLWECLIYVVLAVILAAMLMWMFKVQMEAMVGLYSEVFALQNLWGIGVVLLAMVCVGGVLPAVLFAKIPVSQVFRRFVGGKVRWKMALLFIQFTATIFVICFLGVMFGQYNTLMTNDLGYKYDKLIHTQLADMNENDYTLIYNELKKLSEVEDVTFSNSLIPYSGGGYIIQDINTGTDLFSCDLMAVDSNYIKMHGIELLEGVSTPVMGNYSDTTNIVLENIVVNQEFIRRLGVTGNQLSDFKMFNQMFHICGVVEDFQTASLRSTISPLMISCRSAKRTSCYVTIKLKELTTGNVEIVQKTLRGLFPTKGFSIKSYKETIAWMYVDAQMFRDGVFVSTVFLIIISVMGIVGYVSNEVKRRSREIAVRKVYGSSSASVVLLIMKNLLILTAGAACVSVPSAYIVALGWQSEYIVKMPLYWWIFAGAVIFIVAVIAICVLIQTWRIANENPVESIKSE